VTTVARPAPASWQQLLVAQDRVLSRRQAVRAGLSEQAWEWRLESGPWQSLLPGVAVAHSGTPSARQRAWAAVLYAGPGAALSGDAALAEQGMRFDAVPVIHVAVPAERQVRDQRFAQRSAEADSGRVVVHRVSRLEAWRHPARSPSALHVPAAVLHAAGWASSDRAAEWRVAAAVQQRLTTAARLSELLQDMPRLRRRALVRAVLADVEQGAHAHSELDFLRLLRRTGLPGPDRLQRPCRSNGKRYVDAWWERQRVGVELDGAHHRDVRTWAEDTMRSNALLVAERHERVLLLRFTTGNLRHDRSEVVRQLRAALT
jgi:very-short-patch-repair endonuclease